MKDIIIKRERLSNSKILIYTSVALIIVFFGLQLFVLTTVGAQGDRVNQEMCIRDRYSGLYKLMVKGGEKW